MKDTALPAVSIIIPIYNSEKTISRCIDSVLKQTFDHFELLLIDDGSKDASPEICDKYAEQDSRIRVIHKKNSGVSDSRNLAIGLARGKYLQFIDADDWIAPEMTALLYSMAETHSCDLVISDFYRVIDNRLANKGTIREDGLLTREQYASHMIENPADFYYGVLWNKLYRKDIIDQYRIRMDEKISWCEDFLFNLDYICHTERIYVLRVPVYYYVKTKHSLSSQAGASISKTIQMKTTVFGYYNKFYQEVFGEKEYGKLRLRVYRFLLDAAGDGAVPPAPLPGSLKIGEERILVNQQMMKQDSALADQYLAQKSLKTLLRPIALRFDLQMEEISLLLCLDSGHEPCTRKEWMDILGCSGRKLSSILLSLKAKGLILWNDQPRKEKRNRRKTRCLDIQILPAAQPILEALQSSRENYDKLRFASLTEEEITTYKELSQKIKTNIRNTLL